MMLSLFSTAALVAVVSSYPTVINNCGLETTHLSPPQRAVTLNQGATEIMLALGLEDYMVGTAYLDDEIYPRFADKFFKIPQLDNSFPSYPNVSRLQEVDPDFLYASFSSAFRDDER
eukprot:m.15920 g.15920  ORF g.15920 m.15920 type:complete len:117 (+) comp5527_c1_seq1:236-586(+)